MERWMDACRTEKDSREANFWDIDFYATDPWIVSTRWIEVMAVMKRGGS